jgi:23S rRNA pseudouridine2605 synthase
MIQPIRLQKHIANLGICSRRKAEILIAAGRVRVNGDTVRDMGTMIDPTHDKVEVMNDAHEMVSPEKRPKHVYIILNKPIGYITSTTDEQGVSVIDLITPERQLGVDQIGHIPRLYPVGRLDKDSEGLVLLTNDGTITNMLTHPKYEHEKEYEVTIDTALSRDAQDVLERGMDIEDGERVRGIRVVHTKKIGKRHIVTIVLREGKNRQIRKMFGRLGYRIISLKRTRIGKLSLKTLPVGRWQVVSKQEIV